MDKMWSILLHLGTNMWNEEGNTYKKESNPDGVASSTLRFSKPLFHEIAEKSKRQGLNTIILDLAEGLKYESHPELAVNGSLTREEMEKELEYLRGLGFEVVPKLNFSAGHDVWLGDYSRMISTPTYYQVTSDLINEVCDIFKPKFLHLGMDEETTQNQVTRSYCVVRQYELWWHDLYHLIDCVERNNARAWIWSDYIWHYPEIFLEKCPKNVLQSNWYYELEPNEYYAGNEEAIARKTKELKCFELLDKHGFEQVPTGSNWATSENMEWLTKYCSEHISDNNLLGFMQTPWKMTHESNRDTINDSIERLANAKKWYDANKIIIS